MARGRKRFSEKESLLGTKLLGRRRTCVSFTAHSGAILWAGAVHLSRSDTQIPSSSSLSSISSSSPPSSSLQRPFGAEAGRGIPQGQPRGSAGRLAGHFYRPQPLPRSVHQGLNAGRGVSEIRADRRTSPGQAHSPALPEEPLHHEHRTHAPAPQSTPAAPPQRQ